LSDYEKFYDKLFEQYDAGRCNYQHIIIDEGQDFGRSQLEESLILDSLKKTVTRTEKGTFYLFPGIRKTGLTSAQFCDCALHKAHVLLSPGTAFGAAGDGHVRLAMTAPMDAIVSAMDRLERLSF
jgi:aspartate/methionine/tyrosine aminotransferase